MVILAWRTSQKRAKAAKRAILKINKNTRHLQRALPVPIDNKKRSLLTSYVESERIITEDHSDTNSRELKKINNKHSSIIVCLSSLKYAECAPFYILSIPSPPYSIPAIPLLPCHKYHSPHTIIPHIPLFRTYHSDFKLSGSLTTIPFNRNKK